MRVAPLSPRSGNREAVQILISGLKRLEYRGYDSAGVGLVSSADHSLKVVKKIVSGSPGRAGARGSGAAGGSSTPVLPCQPLRAPSPPHC